jgi:hypothetical protein
LRTANVDKHDGDPDYFSGLESVGFLIFIVYKVTVLNFDKNFDLVRYFSPFQLLGDFF